jgi:hypothetical protein
MIVDGLETGLRELELGLLEGAGETLALPREPLGIDEEAKPLVETQGVELSGALLLGPGLGHGGELEPVELVEGRSRQHEGDLLHW